MVTQRRDRGLCRLSAFDDAGRPGRGARRARRSARAPRAMAPGARRLEGLARPPRLGRRAQDLRGDARRARLPHSRLQGRQRIRFAARLLQLLRAARAPDRFFALCRGVRLVRHGASRTRTSRSASKASSMASATRSCCARACPRRSANRCSSPPTTRSTCATARRRRISPAGPTCCRAQGQKGAPLVTVNTAKVSIDVYRVGDRNLLATVNRDDFLKPIDSSRAEEIASQDGAKVWSGTMDVASAAQPGRRDRLSGA